MLKKASELTLLAALGVGAGTFGATIHADPINVKTVINNQNSTISSAKTISASNDDLNNLIKKAGSPVDVGNSINTQNASLNSVQDGAYSALKSYNSRLNGLGLSNNSGIRNDILETAKADINRASSLPSVTHALHLAAYDLAVAAAGNQVSSNNVKSAASAETFTLSSSAVSTSGSAVSGNTSASSAADQLKNEAKSAANGDSNNNNRASSSNTNSSNTSRTGTSNSNNNNGGSTGTSNNGSGGSIGNSNSDGGSTGSTGTSNLGGGSNGGSGGSTDSTNNGGASNGGSTGSANSTPAGASATGSSAASSSSDNGKHGPSARGHEFKTVNDLVNYADKNGDQSVQGALVDTTVSSLTVNDKGTFFSGDEACGFASKNKFQNLKDQDNVKVTVDSFGTGSAGNSDFDGGWSDYLVKFSKLQILGNSKSNAGSGSGSSNATLPQTGAASGNSAAAPGSGSASLPQTGDQGSNALTVAGLLSTVTVVTLGANTIMVMKKHVR